MSLKYEFLNDKGAPAMASLRKFMKAVKKEISEAEIQLPKQTLNLAKQAGRYMAQRVRLRTKRKGATDTLATALESSVRFRRSSKNNFTINVGNKALLPDYWAMINYGGYVSPEFVYGFWSDGTGKSDYSKRGGKGKGEFVAAKGGSLMTPRRAIKGFHYIAYAHVRMSSYMKRNYNIFNGKKL